MSLYTKACLVILGYFFSFIIVLNTCKKLEGYRFPVYSTEFCPGNESEWNKRSSALNCNMTNGYTCLPNENFTELLEFCYTAPFIWIQEGVCLYLKRKGSYVDAYSCSHFIDGCHNTSYQSRRIFDYPACITIGNGCFLAEQSCKSSPNTTHQSETSGIDKDDWLWVLIVIGIIVVVCFSSSMLYVYRKRTGHNDVTIESCQSFIVEGSPDTRQANKVILLSGYNSPICGIINRYLRQGRLTKQTCITNCWFSIKEQ